MVVVLLIALAPRIAAHEVPNEVTVLGFVHPEGQTLRLLIRAPLKSMRDVDVPTVAGGFLDFSKMEAAERHAAQVWIRDFVEVYENGQQLTVPVIAATRTSLPSDRSFESYDAALANITTGAKLDQSTEIYWEQGMLDVVFEYPIQSDQSDFAIRPGLTRLGLQVNVVLRFLQPGKAERAFDVHADTGIVHLDPRWHQAFYLFAREGFFHILDGIDHLLFLLCLVIPFRKLRPLVIVVTSFTVAHSVTLIASAFGMAPDSLWFPPLIETLIAISIVYMAFENIVGAKLQRRWVVTFGVRLVHGFGFSFLLRERLQFAGDHLLTSLLAFNVGVEIGQLPCCWSRFRRWRCSSATSSPSGSARSCCRRSSRTPRGTGRSIAARRCMTYPLAGIHAAGRRGGHSAADGDRRRRGPVWLMSAVDRKDQRELESTNLRHLGT